jgi:hypothetical protein
MIHSERTCVFNDHHPQNTNLLAELCRPVHIGSGHHELKELNKYEPIIEESYRIS